MRLLLNAVLLALAVPLGFRGTGGDSAEAVLCNGVLEGLELTTTLEYPEGSKVEAPWRIVEKQRLSGDDGRRDHAVVVTLDRMVESGPDGIELTVTPFTPPITTTFEGPTERAMVQQAAEMWCSTVLRAHHGSEHPAAPEEPEAPPIRVASL